MFYIEKQRDKLLKFILNLNDQKKHFIAIVAIALLIHIVSAINSIGYYHYDEHYQIVEFAGIKLGFNQETDLAWEYGDKIRSALQPSILFIIVKVLTGLGVINAYDQMLVVRLLTAIFALASIFIFSYSTLDLVKDKYKVPYFYLSFLSWYLFFVNVRFSSETWSGLFFILAISCLIKVQKENYKYILVGILLGMSFLFRYQMAIVTIGFFCWLILVQKINLKNSIYLIISFLFIVQLGMVIDAWFYGYYDFTFWNYFRINILENKASYYGVDPWYMILEHIVFGPIFIFGIFILGSVVINIIRTPKSIFLWTSVPFILLHMIIDHKELRFLFPLIYLIPIVTITALQELELISNFQFKSEMPMGKFVLLTLLILAMVINIIAISEVIISPANNGKKITWYISKMYSRRIHLFYTRNNNPFNPILPLQEKFYKNPLVFTQEIASIEEFINYPKKKDSLYMLVINTSSAERKSKILRDAGLKKVISSTSNWKLFLRANFNPKIPNNLEYISEDLELFYLK